MKSLLPCLLASFITICILTGCQSVNSAMTPGVRVTTDDFDDSKVIRQDPVSSSASLTEDWHTLGFSWNAATPNKVYLTVGVYGTQNIFGLAFNVGGRTITAETASLTTEYGPWSTRRFAVNYSDFETLATAPMVKMKVSGANTYGVSSFGTSTNALVGKKFPAFLQQVRTAKGSQ